jgi:hypothetical protein
LSDFGLREWIAGLSLGVVGGALAFILWALARTSFPRSKKIYLGE